MRSGIRGRVSRAANAKLAVLIVTNFVDMVGLLMIIPLMPFYAREMGGGALVVAILMSAFTAAQLLSAPWWGRFSDRYGRRPALLIGLSAACIAYVVFGIAGSLWLYWTPTYWNLLSPLTASSKPLARASVVDTPGSMFITMTLPPSGRSFLIASNAALPPPSLSLAIDDTA